MDDFLDGLDRAMEGPNPAAALALALCVPDILGSAMHPSLGSQKRYVKWWDQYMLDAYTVDFAHGAEVFLGGADAYALRCAYLHNGSTHTEEQRASEVVHYVEFVFGPVHKIKFGKKLTLNPMIFSGEIRDAARLCLEEIAEQEGPREFFAKSLRILLMKSGDTYRP